MLLVYSSILLWFDNIPFLIGNVVWTTRRKVIIIWLYYYCMSTISLMGKVVASTTTTHIRAPVDVTEYLPGAQQRLPPLHRWYCCLEDTTWRVSGPFNKLSKTNVPGPGTIQPKKVSGLVWRLSGGSYPKRIFQQEDHTTLKLTRLVVPCCCPGG